MRKINYENKYQSAILMLTLLVTVIYEYFDRSNKGHNDGKIKFEKVLKQTNNFLNKERNTWMKCEKCPKEIK